MKVDYNRHVSDRLDRRIIRAACAAAFLVSSACGTPDGVNFGSETTSKTSTSVGNGGSGGSGGAAASSSKSSASAGSGGQAQGGGGMGGMFQDAGADVVEAPDAKEDALEIKDANDDVYDASGSTSSSGGSGGVGGVTTSSGGSGGVGGQAGAGGQGGILQDAGVDVEEAPDAKEDALEMKDANDDVYEGGAMKDAPSDSGIVDGGFVDSGIDSGTMDGGVDSGPLMDCPGAFITGVISMGLNKYNGNSIDLTDSNQGFAGGYLFRYIKNNGSGFGEFDILCKSNMKFIPSGQAIVWKGGPQQNYFVPATDGLTIHSHPLTIGLTASVEIDVK